MVSSKVQRGAGAPVQGGEPPVAALLLYHREGVQVAEPYRIDVLHMRDRANRCICTMSKRFR